MLNAKIYGYIVVYGYTEMYDAYINNVLEGCEAQPPSFNEVWFDVFYKLGEKDFFSRVRNKAKEIETAQEMEAEAIEQHEDWDERMEYERLKAKFEKE